MTTIFEKLQAANLPVISADESGAISMGTMTSEQEILCKDLLLEYFSPVKYTQLLRRRNAKNDALLVTQLKSVTGQQAADYVVFQITNGVTETQALTVFDNALTFAAAKPLLRNMLVGMYRTVDILKLIVKILVALRDQIWPDLPE